MKLALNQIKYCPRCNKELVFKIDWFQCIKCNFVKFKNKCQFYLIINNEPYCVVIEKDKTDIQSYNNYLNCFILDFPINASISKEELQKYLVLL
jgi:ribosomal protein S27AE